jgi:uncharacterized membrane protein (DUF2068 family)
MRLWPKTWHPETWVCSMRGHVTPAAGARLVGPDDAALGAELADGRRLARCLRCDTWVEHVPPTGSDVEFERIPPLAQLPRPRRGKPLHEAIVMRLIALNKGTHALGFSILALAALMLETNLGAVQSFAEHLLSGITGPLSDTGQYANKGWLSRQLERVLHLNVGTIKVVLLVATLYAVVEWTEAIGLWRERRWAEYLTVIATAGFLPLEIRELLHRVTVLRVTALLVNLALLVWLVRNKRLFGLRGGLQAMHDQVDWAAILTSPTPALGRRAPRPTVRQAARPDDDFEPAAD